jgi:hypothetical protein
VADSDDIERAEEPSIPTDKKNGRESVTLSGKELIQLVIFAPVVFTWLFLAARIIWSASSNPETLDNIEGL